jgi:hypothetical protein
MLNGTIILNTDDINASEFIKLNKDQLKASYDDFKSNLPINVEVTHIQESDKAIMTELGLKNAATIHDIELINRDDYSEIRITNSEILDSRIPQLIQNKTITGLSFNAWKNDDGSLTLGETPIYSLVSRPACKKCTIQAKYHKKGLKYRIIYLLEDKTMDGPTEEIIDEKTIKTQILAEIYVDTLVEKGVISLDNREDQLKIASADLTAYKKLTAGLDKIESESDDTTAQENDPDDENKVTAEMKLKAQLKKEIEAENFVDELVEEGKVLKSESYEHKIIAKQSLPTYKSIITGRENMHLKEKVTSSFHPKKDKSEFSYEGLYEHINNLRRG